MEDHANAEAPAETNLSLADVERQLSALSQKVSAEISALARADNSKTRAAELLKMSFRSLRYKTKKLGID